MHNLVTWLGLAIFKLMSILLLLWAVDAEIKIQAYTAPELVGMVRGSAKSFQTNAMTFAMFRRFGLNLSKLTSCKTRSKS